MSSATNTNIMPKNAKSDGSGISSDDTSAEQSQDKEEPHVEKDDTGKKNSSNKAASTVDGDGDGGGSVKENSAKGTGGPADQEQIPAESSVKVNDDALRTNTHEQKAKEDNGENNEKKGKGQRSNKDNAISSATKNDGNTTIEACDKIDPQGHEHQESKQQSSFTPNGSLSRASTTSANERSACPDAAAVAPTPTSSTDSAVLDQFTDNDHASDSQDTLLTMAFNQDGGCLAVGTGSGFRICNTHPFQETFRRRLGGEEGGAVEGGTGIAHIEMLYRTNLLALTGHARSPTYPPNKVMIYDDHLQRPIGELIFRQRVLTTRLRRDRIVVVLRDRVYIYNFSDLALLDKVHTGDNPLGLIGISTDNGGVGGSTTSASSRASDAFGNDPLQRNNGMVLACPSTTRGEVRVELYGLRRTTTVPAHESALGALALSVDGTLLATASERGTVIRLFDTRGVTLGGGGGTHKGGAARDETRGTATTAAVSSSIPLREFRRGVERATITCLTFSLDSNWLGCASNHGTVHIFQTTPDPAANDSSEKATKKKKSSMTGKALRMLPKLVTAPKKYLMDGIQSCAQVRGVPHPRACAFVPDRERTIAVAGTDEYGNGCLLLAKFLSPSGLSGGEAGGVTSTPGKNGKVGAGDSSEAERVGYHRFFKYKSPASQGGSRRLVRNSGRGATAKHPDISEGGAYIDDAPVDMRMNHISMGDEDEDDFVPIDYNNDK